MRCAITAGDGSPTLSSSALYSSANTKNYRLELKSDLVCVKRFPPTKLSFASRPKMTIVNASTTPRCDTWRHESPQKRGALVRGDDVWLKINP
jgi:hypothetical protein